MPKRTDISSILVIGAGPIVIGQACEFDYSGTQAVKALREEGYRVILVNSNPATIMTDPGLADATCVEPITPEVVARVIERERPDAVLPTMGGQTALNTARSLATGGVLERCGTELIGATLEAIVETEEEIRANGPPGEPHSLLRLKKLEFSDRALVRLAGAGGRNDGEDGPDGGEEGLHATREGAGVRPVFKRVDTCAAEFPSGTSYLYSCYEGDGFDPPEDEAEPNQHDGERPVVRRQLRDAPDGASQERALRHHHRRGERNTALTSFRRTVKPRCGGLFTLVETRRTMAYQGTP